MVDAKPLEQESCRPCRGGVEPLRGQALEDLRRRLGPGWEVKEGRRLEKEFKFDDFQQALRFVNQVGALAEAQGHHPDLHLGWGRVKVILWTHKIGGLHENDFILAAKIDRIE